jgi:hypothetical protein
MDASRSDPEFLAQVLDLAVQCGATTINVPDTVGYALPLEFGDFIRELYRLAPSLQDVHVSVHCHNDLGLATANSLAAVRAGATQVECAVSRIGSAPQHLARGGRDGPRTRGELLRLRDGGFRRCARAAAVSSRPATHPAQQGDRQAQRVRRAASTRPACSARRPPSRS